MWQWTKWLVQRSWHIIILVKHRVGWHGDNLHVESSFTVEEGRFLVVVYRCGSVTSSLLRLRWLSCRNSPPFQTRRAG